jgi:hypothetical protein
MLCIARRLILGHCITSAWIKEEFGVNQSVAKRDMQLVGLYLPVDHHQRARTTERRFRLVKSLRGQ